MEGNFSLDVWRIQEFLNVHYAVIIQTIYAFFIFYAMETHEKFSV